MRREEGIGQSLEEVNIKWPVEEHESVEDIEEWPER